MGSPSCRTRTSSLWEVNTVHNGGAHATGGISARSRHPHCNRVLGRRLLMLNPSCTGSGAGAAGAAGPEDTGAFLSSRCRAPEPAPGLGLGAQRSSPRSPLTYTLTPARRPPVLGRRGCTHRQEQVGRLGDVSGACSLQPWGWGWGSVQPSEHQAWSIVPG